MPTVSPTTDPCLAYHCSADCHRFMIERVEPDPPGHFSIWRHCGWSSAVMLCVTGHGTSQGEVDALYESQEGGCSHYTNNPTTNPTTSPTFKPTSNPTVPPTLEPATSMPTSSAPSPAPTWPPCSELVDTTYQLIPDFCQQLTQGSITLTPTLTLNGGGEGPCEDAAVANVCAFSCAGCVYSVAPTASPSAVAPTASPSTSQQITVETPGDNTDSYWWLVLIAALVLFGGFWCLFVWVSNRRDENEKTGGKPKDAATASPSGSTQQQKQPLAAPRTYPPVLPSPRLSLRPAAPPLPRRESYMGVVRTNVWYGQADPNNARVENSYLYGAGSSEPDFEAFRRDLRDSSA